MIYRMDHQKEGIKITSLSLDGLNQRREKGKMRSVTRARTNPKTSENIE